MTKIHALDGLRAIAVITVTVSHLHSRQGNLTFTFAGALGVQLFFVVSGFLITTLLLREEKKHGSISLRRFWMRRMLRIMPAYLVYVIAIWLIDASNESLSVNSSSYLAALTFTTGYAHGDYELGHLWSLGVEMQYYLIWPLVVFLGSPRARWVFAALLILAGIGARVVVYRYFGSSMMFAAGSVCNMDGIILGSILAMLAESQSSVLQSLGGKSAKWVLSCAFFASTLVIGLSLARQAGFITVPIGKLVTALSLAVFVGWIVFGRLGVVQRVLNSAPFCWIGTISYSIYLWQQFVLRPGGLAGIWPVLHWLDQPLAALTATIIISAISYYVLERPLVEMRKRLH